MANRYWVGGSGTWNASSTTNWSTTSGGASGASAPGSTDAAIFDANSNTGTNDFTVTLTGSPACGTLNTTGIDPTNAMTVAGTGNLSVNQLTFTLTNKVLWTNTGTITFQHGGTVTSNVTTAGVSISSNVTVNTGSNSGVLNFVDAFTCTGDFSLTNGTLTTTGSNKNITVKSFIATSGGGSRTVNTGTGTFAVTGNNATVFDGGNATFTSPTSINLTYSGSTGTRSVANVSTLAINVTAGSDSVSIGTSTVKGLNFTGFTGTWTNSAGKITGNLVLNSSMTVGSGANILEISTNSLSITTAGKTLDFPLTLGGTGSSYTITLNDNLTLASGRTLNLGNSANFTIALGANNINTPILTTTGSPGGRGLTTTTGKIVINGNAATIFSSNATTYSGVVVELSYSGSTGTRTISCSSTAGPQLKITAGSDIILNNGNSNFDGIDFTGFSGSFTETNDTTTTGNIILSSMMTTGTGVSKFIFETNTISFTSNGRTFGYAIDINSGTLNLADALTCTQTITLKGGTFNSNNYNVQLATLVMTGTTTRTISLGSGTWTVTGSGVAWNAATLTSATITGTATISMTSSSAKSFSGGGGTWPILNQGGSGALTIVGSNTFTTISNSVTPATVTLTSGTTQTITNFNLAGVGGSLLTLNASTAGTRATISKASGSVSAQYLNIQDNSATGGASFTALNSTNSGNNLGWVFAVPGFFFFFGV